MPPPSLSPLYTQVVDELRGLLTDERDWLANLANTSALLNDRLPDLNWVGFYLWREGQLIVGPFQGRPACVRITLGKGVCGTSAQQRQTIVVPNVHHFPGHIACDERSQSEIVVPLVKDGTLLGVLDLDSPTLERFTEVDQQGLEEVVRVLLAASDTHNV